MKVNGKEPDIGMRYLNSVSSMIVHGLVNEQIVEQYFEVNTEIILTIDYEETIGLVKSYNSMLSQNNQIIAVPINSDVTRVSDSFRGHTIFTENNNLDILYDASDIQEHTYLTNADGFNSVSEHDITVTGKMVMTLLPQSGIIDGLTFSMSQPQNVAFEVGEDGMRRDLILLRKDQHSRSISIVLRRGIPAMRPELPPYEQNHFGIYELPIFSVFIDLGFDPVKRIHVLDLRRNLGKENYTTQNNLCGCIMAFSGGAEEYLPPNSMVCDGRAINRITYGNLYSKFSTLWGEGDGSTTFNIPNLSNRIIQGGRISHSNRNNQNDEAAQNNQNDEAAQDTQTYVPAQNNQTYVPAQDTQTYVPAQNNQNDEAAQDTQTYNPAQKSFQSSILEWIIFY